MQSQALLLQQRQRLQRPRGAGRWAPRDGGRTPPASLCPRAVPNYYVFASDDGRTAATTSTSSSMSTGLLSPDAAVEASTVQLFYRSGWKSALVHGCVQGGEWRDYPLTQVCVFMCVCV